MVYLNLILDKYRKLNIAAKATLWFTICNFILKGINFISTPIFARVLAPLEYGKLSIFMSYEQIILVLSTWEISLSAYQRGLLKYKNEIPLFTKSSIVISNIITTIFFGVILVFFNWFSGFSDLPLHSILLLYVYMLLYPAYTCWITIKRYKYEYRIAVLFTILNALVSVIVPMIAIFQLDKTAVVKFDFTLIGSMIIFIPFYLKNAYGNNLYVNKDLVKDYWKYIITFQAPIVVHSLSYAVLAQADRVMIGKMIGNAEAAYYSVAYNIAQVVSIVQGSIMQAMIPWILNKLENKDYKSTRKSSGFLLLFVGIIVAMFIFVAPEAIKILFSEDYYEAIWSIPPITISVYFMFLNSLFVWFENYYEKTRYVAYASVMCAFINVVLNYFAIGIFGYIACGYTTLISYILFAYLHYLFVKKICKEKGIKEKIYDLRFNMLISIALFAVMLVAVITYKHILIRYIIFSLLLIVLVVERKRIKEIGFNITNLNN